MFPSKMKDEPGNIYLNLSRRLKQSYIFTHSIKYQSFIYFLIQ